MTNTPLGLLGPILEAAGFTLVRRFRMAEHADVDASLVVSLGGSMAATDGEAHPFLRDELAVLLERVANERPCLGIGLGAQLLASAAGADVFTGKNGWELGAAPVRWTQAGMKDSVLLPLTPKPMVAHWHRDTFSPVPGAELLASTDRYTQQAFRLGSSYGFQFHLEQPAETLDRWLSLRTAELSQAQADVAALRERSAKLKSSLRERLEWLERLAAHFARLG